MKTPSSTPETPSLSLLETKVLMVLASGDLHGYGIATEIQRRAPDGPRIFPTNLYRRLHHLVECGLIEKGAAELDDNGRARKNFRITAAGQDYLALETDRLSSLVDELRASAIASSQGSPE